MTTDTKDALTESLTDALLDTLTPAVAAVFREEVDRYLRERVRDTARALIAVDPTLAVDLQTRGTAAHVRRSVEPAVVELVGRDPGRSFVSDAASELCGVLHAQFLNELSAAVSRAPRPRKRTRKADA